MVTMSRMHIYLALPVKQANEGHNFDRNDTKVQSPIKWPAATSYNTYVLSVLILIGAYLAGIGILDRQTCDKEVARCRTYGNVEFAFTKKATQEVLVDWDDHAKRLMCVSSGLHIFGAFLYTQMFIYIGLASQQFFLTYNYSAGWLKASTTLMILGRLFNCIYVIAHCLVATMYVNPDTFSKNIPPAVAILLAISLALLATCAISMIGLYAVWLKKRLVPHHQETSSLVEPV